MKIVINGKEIEVSNEDISKAIEEKKESIEVKADYAIRTADEDKQYSDNVRKEGLSVGTEIGRKNIIKALGIEGEGLHKTDETALDAITNWNKSTVQKELESAKIEPNKKVEELTKDLSTLQGTIKNLTTEKESVMNEFNTYKKTQTINSTISNLIPENTILPKSDMMTLISTKIKVDVDDNGRVYGVGSDGQPIKDSTTLEPLPIDKVVGNFFSENANYLKGSSGGAGGSDSGAGGGKQSVDEFIKEMKDKGITPNSEPFVKEMNERIKVGTLDA